MVSVRRRPGRILAAGALALLFRIGLIIYGSYQDATSSLKYTDVDYRVFSDAAYFLLYPKDGEYAQGWLPKMLGWELGDPYSRATYRYTPLLAVAMIPNELVHPAFGKLLFSLCDVMIGIFLLYLSPLLGNMNGYQGQPLAWVGGLWLLDPMPANISTRGSAESVLGLMVISTLAFVGGERYDAAAVMLGLAVHFKIYPFIYAASILAVLPSNVVPKSNPSLGEYMWRQITWARIRFGVVSFATFAGLNLLMYSIWGQPFLEHTYLYHLTRRDHRHNFSPYFYSTYLSFPHPSATYFDRYLPATISAALRSSLVSFGPQMLLAVGSGFLCVRHERDLPFAWFVQTALFVTFNKVCTSQYFMWYLWFLPLVLPRLALSLRESITLLSLWVGAQAVWLSIAYRLEFLGHAVFPQLWIASIAFLVVNAFVLGRMIQAYK
ncbi:glycosyltransferase family 50 protein [Clavulina sp. PMI_390]|nr:glycosyltransferase family 50 protein [Clavulina sp. PMI_390]